MRFRDKIGPLHDPILKPANLPDFLAVARNSAYCPLEERQRAWAEIGKTRPLKGLEKITEFYSLEEVPELAQALLDGKLRGRCLITIAGVEKALVQ